jgi:hypothetical protein
MRPIQFVDNTRLLVLKPDGLYVLSAGDGKLEPLFIADSCVFTNAHLSSDGKCACAVRARSHESKPTGVTIWHVETGVTTALNFGCNTNVDDQAQWLVDCTIPLRVHNGMVTIVAKQAA